MKIIVNPTSNLVGPHELQYNKVYRCYQEWDNIKYYTIIGKNDKKILVNLSDNAWYSFNDKDSNKIAEQFLYEEVDYTFTVEK